MADPAQTNTQRRRVDREAVVSSVVRIDIRDGKGNPRSVTAGVVDVIDGGCGLQLRSPLKSGSIVMVRGKLGNNRAAEYLRACVRWCVGVAGGAFRAGLQFPNSASRQENSKPIDSGALDCYEVMQLSPHADSETVSRVYRMLAFRYHPDNLETGNSEKFIGLTSAYRILSDPQKRAEYDSRYRPASSKATASHGLSREADPAKAKRSPWKIFGSGEALTGGNTKYLNFTRSVRVSRPPAENDSENRSYCPPAVGTLGGWTTAVRLP